MKEETKKKTAGGAGYGAEGTPERMRARRDFLKRALVASAYAAPVFASFSGKDLVRAASHQTPQGDVQRWHSLRPNGRSGVRIRHGDGVKVK